MKWGIIALQIEIMVKIVFRIVVIVLITKLKVKKYKDEYQ